MVPAMRFFPASLTDRQIRRKSGGLLREEKFVYRISEILYNGLENRRDLFSMGLGKKILTKEG